MGVIETGHNCLTRAVDYSGFGTPDRLQAFIAGDEQNPVAFNSHHFGGGLGGVESNHPGILQNKVGNWHFLIYLTPLVPLSFEGEGKRFERGAEPLSNLPRGIGY